MSPEQRERLRVLAGEVFEAVVIDCNPAHWTGAGKRPDEMDAKQRGDAVWCRKQAASTLMLYERLNAIVNAGADAPPPAAGEPPEETEEEMIARFEAKARASIAALEGRWRTGLTERP